MSESVDVVIVAYRCRALLRACLASLAQFGDRIGDIDVVDNDSRDGTAPMVRAEFPDVRLTEAGANIGFGRANNLAIPKGTSPYVLLLNPDTRLHPGSLERLVSVMRNQPDVGICGCRLELEDGTLDHAAKRSFPTPLGALGHFTGISRLRRAPSRLAQYTAPSVTDGRVDAVNGALMLVRRDALEAVGLFDEGYWMYMEDLDLCYRFALQGWAVWYEPLASASHVKSGSAGKYRSFRLNYAFHYGMFRFYRAHYASEHHWLYNSMIYAGIALKWVVSTGRTSALRLMTNRRLSRPIAERARGIESRGVRS